MALSVSGVARLRRLYPLPRKTASPERGPDASRIKEKPTYAVDAHRGGTLGVPPEPQSNVATVIRDRCLKGHAARIPHQSQGSRTPPRRPPPRPDEPAAIAMSRFEDDAEASNKLAIGLGRTKQLQMKQCEICNAV